MKANQIITIGREFGSGGHEVGVNLSKKLGIPFYEDVITAGNRRRIEPVFEMSAEVGQPNVILYDDIITTGSTLTESRRLLTEAGKNVLAIAAIRNQ